MPGPATYEVLFDGGCGLCNRTVRWLRWADVRERLRFSDIGAEWDRLSREHPSLDPDACLAEMHVVAPDGSVTAGFDGFRALSHVVPAMWPAMPFLYVPGVPLLGRRVYRYVARHRSTTCRLPHVPRA